MHIVFFDEILEQHTVRSLARALESRGHRVTRTGPIWSGHLLPEKDVDKERIRDKVHELAQSKPDAVLTFRAATLLPEMVEHLRAGGAHTFVWLPDDPVLHHVCYRHVVDAYDTMLHCGGAGVLSFYEHKHGRSGVNFPFWTDAEEFPYCYHPAAAECDLVFLGNCRGKVRGNRYDFISSLPFRKRIYGKVPEDPYGLCVGYLKETRETAQALGRSRCALNIPQLFSDYRDSEYEFPELESMGHFEFPSRVIQYAAAGVPILSLEPRGIPSTFPELVDFRDRAELVEKTVELLGDQERLIAVSRATHARFLRSFSADARAVLLEQVIQEPGLLNSWSLEQRATGFANILPADVAAEPAPGMARGRIGELDEDSLEEALPGIEQQCAALRELALESSRKWRILHLGKSLAVDSPESRTRRALLGLGHHVFSHAVAPERAGESLGRETLAWLIKRFEPRVIICDGEASCLTESEIKIARQRRVLLIATSPCTVEAVKRGGGDVRRIRLPASTGGGSD